MLDGETIEMDPPHGFVIYHEEWTHRVENIGTADLKAIVVESK